MPQSVKTQEVIALFEVLFQTHRKDLPPSLPHIIAEAAVQNSGDAEWKDSEKLLRIGQAAGLPLRLRRLPVSLLLSRHEEHLFPSIGCIPIEGVWQVVIFTRQSPSGGLFYRRPLEDEERALSSGELERIVALHADTARANALASARATLEGYGISSAALIEFTRHHDQMLLPDITRACIVYAGQTERQLILARHFLDDPELLTLWLQSQPNHYPGQEESYLSESGLPIMLPEGHVPYISDLRHASAIDTAEGDDRHHHPSPVERAMHLIKMERRDITVVAIYGVVIGLISLVTPLTVNTLVSTISTGIFTFPLVVLSLVIFFGLLIAGAISIVQQYVVEVLQQRIFVNTAFEVAHKIPAGHFRFFQKEYAPELLNRFFDVITVQKGVAKLLIDGLSAVIVGAAGLVLLVFISPSLLAIGLLFILLSIGLVALLGRKGLTTSINESKKKYDVVAFLEDVGRCMTSFKLTGSPTLVYQKIDELLGYYLHHRRAHFRILVRQFSGFSVIRAIVNTGVLAIGGLLVIERQITLGQLIATEIIIVTLITSLDKLFRQLELTYDLLTAMDKVGHITDIELERVGGHTMPERVEGMSIRCKNVGFSYEERPVLQGLDFYVNAGSRVSLVGKSGAGKSTLAHLLLGMYDPTVGTILMDEFDSRMLDLGSLRRNVGLVLPNDEIFEGTIWDNIVMGRSGITPQDVMEAVAITRLDDVFFRQSQGLQTIVLSHGKNLSTGQIRRLMIARAIVHKPRLLILDEAFTGLEENIKIEILTELYDRRHPWTIVGITHDPEVVAAADTVFVLSNGHIVEIGAPRKLAGQNDSVFSALFPDLSHVLRSFPFTQSMEQK
ncbi:MAG: ATP-binding cassette domain-containing protein [Candidatus Kapaibacterium sp.]